MTRWGSRSCSGSRGGGNGRRIEAGEFGGDRLGRQRAEHFDLTGPRRLGAMVGEVDDFALAGALDRCVRRINKALQPLGKPVITPRLARLAVHPLLDHDPMAIVGDDEAVQIEVEAVLHRGAVDLGDQPAGAREPSAVETDLVADRRELVGRLARVPAATAADVQAKLGRARLEPAFQRADDAGGDARRMPVHPHHRAERLEPERVRQPTQQLVAAVVKHNRLGHHRAEPRHPVGQPLRNPAAVQRQIGVARPPRHVAFLASQKFPIRSSTPPPARPAKRGAPMRVMGSFCVTTGRFAA